MREGEARRQSPQSPQWRDVRVDKSPQWLDVRVNMSPQWRDLRMDLIVAPRQPSPQSVLDLVIPCLYRVMRVSFILTGVPVR